MAFRGLLCMECSHFYLPEWTGILDIYPVVTQKTMMKHVERVFHMTSQAHGQTGE